MIESKKVKGKAKSVVLPNGREVTYCETLRSGILPFRK